MAAFMSNCLIDFFSTAIYTFDKDDGGHASACHHHDTEAVPRASGVAYNPAYPTLAHLMV